MPATLSTQCTAWPPVTLADAPRPRRLPQEWERLRQLGMISGLGEDDLLDLQCLDAWCRSAASDMLLLEALQGAPLLPLQPLAEVLPRAVGFDAATGEWLSSLLPVLPPQLLMPPTQSLPAPVPALPLRCTDLPVWLSLCPPAGVPTLQRPAGRDVVQQLVAALAAARPHASSEWYSSPWGCAPGWMGGLPLILIAGLLYAIPHGLPAS